MAERLGVELAFGLRVPMRDGASLSAILYRPDAPGGRPALIAMTPYGAPSHHERAMRMAPHGYACLSVDVRGRGDSDGSFHPLQEASDVQDVIAWAADQPWCDGRVAMWGASYLGYCQWRAIRQARGALRTIVPTAAPFFGVDFPMRSGVFASYVVQWLGLVSSRAPLDRIFGDAAYWRERFKSASQAARPFRQLDEWVGFPSPIFKDWVSHPAPDPYWDQYNPSEEDYAGCRIPVLTITGAYDADQLGALAHYRRHLSATLPAEAPTHYLVIGPWDHAGCSSPKREYCGIEAGEASLVDLEDLHRQWYDWVLRDEARPAFLSNRVVYYVLGAEEWRNAESLAAISSAAMPLHLSAEHNPIDVFSSGTLGDPDAAGIASAEYRYDPLDPALAEVEAGIEGQDYTDQRLVLTPAGERLVYHSAPFTAPVDVCGFFRLDLRLSIDVVDTDLYAVIFMIATDGGSIMLTRDWLRARNSRGDAISASRGEEGVRHSLANFMFVARRIPAGARLRLVIGPLNSIHWARNLNSGGIVEAEDASVSRVAMVRLHHGGKDPSILWVPIGASGGGCA